MRLSLTQENLSKALGAVGRVVSARATLPVLANVLLTTDGNRLRLSATNLEVGVNYWIGSKVDQEGSLTVPAKLFAEFVSNLPRGNVSLEGNDASLMVKTDHYESKINGISAEEFPTIPEVTTDPVLQIEGEVLREALAQVVVAASADEARPVLAAVYMYVEEGTLYLVATDSYRLAERKIELAKAPEAEVSVIVPIRTMQELLRLLGEVQGEVEMYRDENQVMFRIGEVELISRLIEGQFPPYRQIMPKSSETSFEIEVSEFSRLVKVASLFARESSGSVKLEIKPEGEVRVIAGDSEVGGNTSSAMCRVAGDDGEVSLNARYLQDALSVMKSKKVMFAISGKLNPCVLVPLDDDEENYIHIVMPLKT